MCGTRLSPMVTQERLPFSVLFFSPHVLEIAQPDFTRKDVTVNGVPRTLSRINRIFVNLPVAEARDFHFHSHVFENPIPSDHVPVRVVFQTPTIRNTIWKEMITELRGAESIVFRMN